MIMLHEDGDALTTSASSEPLLSSSLPPQDNNTTTAIFLSFPLRMLYGGIGMIMSLPSTALLYLVNTYIAIPVSLLPLYLSIGFLPYSLKPSYAYLSTTIQQQLRHYSNSNYNNYYGSPQVQMMFLFSTCGLSYIFTAFLPPHAVILCFILAWTRSITLAWPTFLLDLCLLDEVDDIIRLVSSRPPSPSPPSPPQGSSLSYAEVAATLQSQAATYRSMGCVLANTVALILVLLWSTTMLIWSYNNDDDDKNQHSRHSPQEGLHNNDGSMNHRMFQFILIGTGMLNFVGVIFLWHVPCRPPLSVVPSSLSNPLPPSDDSLVPLTSNHTTSLTAANDDATTTINTRVPSYDSVNELHRPSSENRAEIVNHGGGGGGLLEMNTWTGDSEPLLSSHDADTNTTGLHQNNHNDGPSTHSDHYTHGTPPDHGNAIWLVVSLQLLLVLLSLRGSMVQSVTNKIAWTGMVTLLTGLFLFSAYDLSSPWRRRRRRNVTGTNGTFTPSAEPPMRVGLYLILRNAIPSVSYLMSSFIYTVYQERPFIIQVLSLLDMCVTTFACHIYSQYLSRYSSGRQLIWLIVVTSLLSGVSSFGNVILIRLLDPKSSPQPHNHDSSMMIKIACTMVINAIMGLFNEWNFFPDVVLATVSTTLRDISSSSSVSNVSTGDTLPPNDASRTDRTTDDDDNENDAVPTATNHATAATRSSSDRSVRYGTLLSCIDLGDQIGLLLAGPLIAICHTTRSSSSNDDDHPVDHWEHLERLQMVNSIMILLSTLLVFILIIRR